MTRGQIGTGGNCWRHLQDVSLGLSLRGQIENKTALKQWQNVARNWKKVMLCVWCTTEQHSDRVCEKAVMWQWAVIVSGTWRVALCDSCLVSSVWLVGEGAALQTRQTNRAKFLSFACCLSFSALIFIRLRLAPHWKHRTLDCVTQAPCCV